METRWDKGITATGQASNAGCLSQFHGKITGMDVGSKKQAGVDGSLEIRVCFFIYAVSQAYSFTTNLVA